MVSKRLKILLVLLSILTISANLFSIYLEYDETKYNRKPKDFETITIMDINDKAILDVDINTISFKYLNLVRIEPRGREFIIDTYTKDGGKNAMFDDISNGTYSLELVNGNGTLVSRKVIKITEPKIIKVEMDKESSTIDEVIQMYKYVVQMNYISFIRFRAFLYIILMILAVMVVESIFFFIYDRY